jgi:ABC-type nitrate/sulfonate/bicarbonate transport system substrate-binding protein
MKEAPLLSGIKHLLLFSLESILLMLLISAVSVFLASCQKENKVPGPLEKITIAYSTAGNVILLYIAFEKGYFAEEGLDATSYSIPLRNSPLQRRQLLMETFPLR